MTWRTTVDFLVQEFRATLLDLTPHLDNVRINWKQNTYDDWDAISEALYTNIVVRTIEYAEESGGELAPALTPARYGFYYDSYTGLSFTSIVADRPGVDELLAFIEFATSECSFDRIVYQRLIGPDLRPLGKPEQINSQGARFQFVLKRQQGIARVVSNLSVPL